MGRRHTGVGLWGPPRGTSLPRQEEGKPFAGTGLTPSSAASPGCFLDETSEAHMRQVDRIP